MSKEKEKELKETGKVIETSFDRLKKELQRNYKELNGSVYSYALPIVAPRTKTISQ